MKKVKTKVMQIKDLHPADYNPREISPDALIGLGNSVERYGLVELIIWNERSGKVVGGHQRLKVLEDMGEKKTTVIVVDLDDIDEKALNITLNNPTIAGDFTSGLHDLLAEIKIEAPELSDLLNLGELEAFTASLLEPSGPKGGLTDPNSVPDIPEKPTSKVGDLWILGDHRLVCGDSCQVGTLDILMGKEKAEMIFTDPPWNVNYGANKSEKYNQDRTILNDHMTDDQWAVFVSDFCASLFICSKPGAMIYLVMSAQEWPVIDKHLREAGFHWSSTIIWAKDRMVISRKDYHTQYEPIWYGWNEAGPRLFPLKDRKQTDLWEVDRPSVSELHPTTKPVELIEKAITNSSGPGGIVVDLFGGSGSTMIACERLGRKARLVELDPKYSDVIIKRWEEFTGETAVCESAD